MQRAVRIIALGAILFGLATNAQAQVNVYAGYLNNLTGAPNPADIPTPFDADATTILISSGGAATNHDTGVLRFENLCNFDVTIDAGLNVTTENGYFQIWDSPLPVILTPGMNLVLAETVNYDFDTSDFGLGINPVVAGSIDGMAFSFIDTARILLGHEEAGGTAETTPYGLLGRVECVPEPSSIVLLSCGALCGLALLRRTRR